MQYRIPGCTLQRSFDDWPTHVGLQYHAHTSSARQDVQQQQITVCERFPTCRHAVVAQAHEVQVLVAVLPSTEDPSACSPQTRHLPPAREIAEAVLTDHIGTRVPEAIPPLQVSFAAWEPIIPYRSSDRQPCVQPIIDEPTNYGAMQEIVQLSDKTQLDTNVTQAKKHTPDDKEQLHLRIPPDALVLRFITTY